MTEDLNNLNINFTSDHEVSPCSIENISTRLKRVALKNFLSFEAEEIEFDQDFTIITGPNGAGKSSVFQALKFVLGSNNYDGRYQKWSDFIRTGQDSAMVQLDLEFEGQIYSIQRIVSKKNALYTMMKSPKEEKFHSVNMNELKNKLTQFGLNPDNIFSFMSQGNIDSIKDLKEETLCTFIESGIGLLPLRQNILEQRQKITQLDGQYHSLLIKMDNYKMQLRDLIPRIERLNQKHSYLKQLGELHDELLWAQKEQILKEIQCAQEKVNNLEPKIMELSHSIEQKELRINELTQDIYNHQIQQTHLEDKISNHKLLIKTLQTDLDLSTSEKSQLLTQIESLTLQIDRIKKESLKLETEKTNNQDQMEKVKTKLHPILTEIQELRDEERKINREIQKYQKEVLDYQLKQKSIEQIDTDIEKWHTKHKETEEKIAQKLKEIEGLHNKLSGYAWFLEKTDQDPLQKHQNIEVSLKEKLQTHNKDIERLNHDYEKITSKIEEIKKSYFSKELPKPTPIVKLSEKITELGLNVTGPLIDYISFDDSISQAIQSIFGEFALYSFIAKDKESFYRLKEQAYQLNAKCTLYQEKSVAVEEISKVPEVENDGFLGYLVHKISFPVQHPEIKKVVYSIVGKTLLVKDHVAGVQYINRYKVRDRIVTLDGEQIRPKDYVIETRLNFKGKKIGSVTQAKQELENYEKLAQENRNKVNEIQEQIQKNQKNYDIVQKRLRQIPELMATLKRMEIMTQSKNGLINDREYLFSQIEDHKNQKVVLIREMNLLKKQFPEDLMEKQSRIEKIPDILTDLEQKQSQFQLSIQNYQENLNRLALEINSLMKDNESNIAKKVQIEQELKQIDGIFYAKFQEITKLKKEIDEIATQISILASEKDEQIIEKDSIISEKNELTNMITQLTIEKTQLTAEMNLKQSKLDEIACRIHHDASCNTEIRSIEEISNEISNLEKILRNYCDVDDQLLQEKQMLEETINGIQHKENDLQNELNAAKSTEKSFESKYISEFNKSIIAIQNIINKMFKDANITAEVLLMLDGVFDSLRLKITTTFASTCQYPLHALSGGQRSMVGICLMLALHKLNPSPFSIYDEIEMFLDPENAQTVARLIYNMTKEGVQFILIMPDTSRTLIQLAQRVVGITRNGKTGPSIVFYGVTP